MRSPLYIKYPRTPHLPWSLGQSGDDATLNAITQFQGKTIICTEKRDGECSSLYADGYIHARSIDSTGHQWQSWLKRFWQERYFNLSARWRVCGENLYAQHSIPYALETYFEGFSLWDGDRCLRWQETLEWFELLDIKPVPILYEGLFDEAHLRHLARSLNVDSCEGYVIRLVDSFNYSEFGQSVAKYVRANHVQTDNHWTRQWQPNHKQI